MQETPLPVSQITQQAMGTIMTHKAYGQNADEALVAVFQEVIRLEKLLSRFLPGSDISQINQNAGFIPTRISRESFIVLNEAVKFSKTCPGCFDITIEPLVNLWKIGKERNLEPEEMLIEMTIPLVNYEDLILNPFENTAGLRNFGQSIDLGGIGKGYTADRVKEVFLQYGVHSAYSNLGGNVVTLGTKPDGSPWVIGIQHPRREKQLIGAVSVLNQTVVTSGDYQRYYIDGNGNRHHHIIDPKTGYPAESDLMSVTIVSENSLVADALSTIIFIAGLNKGRDILQGYPQTGAVLVDTKMTVYITRDLSERFLSEEGFEVTVLK